MEKKISIGMAELVAVKAPAKITTIGLGSCVGICLFDQKLKIAGMAHTMLPDSTKIINNSNKAKFVDTAIKLLISEMEALGASKNRLTAKIAGGAQMFNFVSANEGMRIGDRNIEATIKILKQYNIPILASEVRSNYGRTITFDSSNGELLVSSINHGRKTI